MATATNTNTDTDLRNKELEAERTRQLLELSREMRREEDQMLQTVNRITAPTMPSPRAQPPVVSRGLPSEGKIYMGRNISPEQFAALPAGIRVTPPRPAPLSPEQQVAMQRRIAQGTELARHPETRTVDPAMMRFEAQQRMRRAIEGGMPVREAMMTYGLDLFGGKGAPTFNQLENIRLGEERNRLARERQASLEQYRASMPIRPISKLTPDEDRQLQSARILRTTLLRDLNDPMKIPARTQIQSALDTAQKTIDILEGKAGLASSRIDLPRRGEPGSSRDNPIIPRTRKEAQEVPSGKWFRDPKGNVIQRK